MEYGDDLKNTNKIDHKENSTNIFNLIKDIESLTIEDRVSLNSCEKNYTDMGSMNEDQFFNRSPSIDYFRSSSLGENGSSPFSMNNNFNDDYFNDGKKKLFSKNLFAPNDFIVISTIGNGAYSKVIKVQHKKTGDIFAVKIFEKAFMYKENKFYQIYVENDLLNMCNHPNIVKIYGAYESDEMVYLVLEYCNKGDLSEFISKYGIVFKF
jgi:hypothetical protein